MTAVFAALCLGLLILLTMACMKIERLFVKLEEMVIADHKDCIADVVLAVSDKHEVNVLRLAAIAVDSPLGQHEMRILSRQWTHDGPSTQRMWLEARARQIEEGRDG